MIYFCIECEHEFYSDKNIHEEICDSCRKRVKHNTRTRQSRAAKKEFRLYHNSNKKRIDKKRV